MIAKCTVGVPILNVGGALTKAPEAAFVYVDNKSYGCYYYVLYQNRNLHIFCGKVNRGEGFDIFSDGYISKIGKARSKYISKDDYNAIMNWAYESDSYSEDYFISDIEEECRIYYYNGEIRILSDEHAGMIDSSECIFNDILNNYEFYDYELLRYAVPEDRFSWWYDGERYVPRIVVGYNDHIYYMKSRLKDKENNGDK